MQTKPLKDIPIQTQMMDAGQTSCYTEEHFRANVDDALDATSINPVENRVISNALNQLLDYGVITKKIQITIPELVESGGFYGIQENDSVVVIGSLNSGLYYIDKATASEDDPNNFIKKASLTEVGDRFDLPAEQEYFKTSRFKSIIYADKFVAVECSHINSNPDRPDLESYNKIYVSADGMRWKFVSKLDGVSNLCNNIITVGDTYYFVQNKTMKYSNDLVSWQSVNFSASSEIIGLGYCVKMHDGNLLCFPVIVRRPGETVPLYVFDTETKQFQTSPRLTINMASTYYYDRPWCTMETENGTYVGVGVRSHYVGGQTYEPRSAKILLFNEDFTSYQFELCEEMIGVPRAFLQHDGRFYCGTYSNQLYELTGRNSWKRIYVDENIIEGMLVFDGQACYVTRCEINTIPTFTKFKSQRQSVEYGIDMSYIFQNKEKIYIRDITEVIQTVRDILVGANVDPGKIVTSY